MNKRGRERRLYPAEVFYDGACPLCRREMKRYERRDARGWLHFVDIAKAGFDARDHGLDPKRVSEVMHARTADGVIHTELDAFGVIWGAMAGSLGARLALAIFRVPGMMFLGGIFYRWFARNRYRLTGRCEKGSCDVV